MEKLSFHSKSVAVGAVRKLLKWKIIEIKALSMESASAIKTFSVGKQIATPQKLLSWTNTKEWNEKMANPLIKDFRTRF